MEKRLVLDGSTDPQIEAWFTYHAPTSTQLEKYENLRAAAKHMAYTIKVSTPVGADQSAAYRLLRECVMTANAAVALEGKV